MTKHLTIKGKEDGFGAQYQACMSGIAYCLFKNYTYIHTPFESLEHVECAALLNEFIGVKSDDDASKKKPDIVEPYISQVHYAKNPSMYYTTQALEKIRQMYYSTAKPNPCNYDIAIHIRRGDVNPSVEERYTSNDFYINLVTKLEDKYPDYNICIYSEGKADDFGDLKFKNIFFCLNEDIKKSFHGLVTAKILVTSKSSFSYSAALLSVNDIYYIPFWHRPLDNWAVISENNLEASEI